jgi:hypothetical protein
VKREREREREWCAELNCWGEFFGSLGTRCYDFLWEFSDLVLSGGEFFLFFFPILEEVFGGKKEREVGRFGRRTESKKRRKGLLLIENGLRVLECRKFSAAFDVRLFQILFLVWKKCREEGGKWRRVASIV